MSNKFRGFILYTLTAGILMGGFSFGSDHLPYVGKNIPFVYSVYVYLAVTSNSLAFWFVLSMIPGFIYAVNLKESVIFGCIAAVTGITFYLVIGEYFGDMFRTYNYNWYVPSALGGMIGGAAGYFAKRNKNVLLILIPGFLLQLLRNGTDSWNNGIGMVHNLTICIMILILSIYIIRIRLNKSHETKS
ncbi:hypothetical protein [Halobacillus litoralis]|uniref:hypothetical protein n=1 Tax=Halobacillus litoralis TaxID=45668 RepID=UPI001CD78E6D|nr:hypothetical protein [Halobacillus litoralis]MCA1022752.1 hypothetical protein [Halobacillus litoralis]